LQEEEREREKRGETTDMTCAPRFRREGDAKSLRHPLSCVVKRWVGAAPDQLPEDPSVRPSVLSNSLLPKPRPLTSVLRGTARTRMCMRGCVYCVGARDGDEERSHPYNTPNKVW
jgi:hypothetical protein